MPRLNDFKIWVQLLVTVGLARPWYLSRWLARGVAALLLYAVLGFLLVPAALRHYLPQIVDRQVARQLSLGELRINPFLLTVEIRDCALREADGAVEGG